MQNLDEHAAGLRDWIERCAAGPVVRCDLHTGGSHRIAWQIDVNADAGQRELFLTLDSPDAGGDDGERDGDPGEHGQSHASYRALLGVSIC